MTSRPSLSLGTALVPPFKTASQASFLKPIRAHIASAYGEDPAQFEDDLRALDALRAAAAASEPHEESALALLRYYGQLLHLNAKFDFGEDGIRILFGWTNSLGKEIQLSSSYNIGFELASVLFNLAVVYASLGAAERRESDESFKRAASYFQQSAGCFSAIVDNLSVWKISGSSSIQLNALSQLMLAQAQEVFIGKAIAGKMKDATLAKLMAQATVFYTTAFEIASQTDIFDKSWTCQMQARMHHWQAMSHYRKSLEVLDSGKYGEQIAWLQSALSFSKKANENSIMKHVQFTKVQEEIKSAQSMIEKALQQANKDNDVIYMEVVPKFETLTAVVPARMVNLTPLPDLSVLTGLVGKPPLHHLVPFAVHQAVSEYENKKDTLAKDTAAKLTEATSLAFTTLASVNLPAAIEALEQPIGLPAALLQRSEDIRKLGGIRSLESTWATITALSKKNWETLANAVEALDKEEAEDASMRMQFGSRWTRVTSSTLTHNLRDSERQLRKKLQEADSANRVVRSKLDANVHLIVNLCASREELEASIPASTTASTLALKDPNVKALKGLLEQLNANIKRRTDLVTRIKKAATEDDISPLVLDAVAKSTVANASSSSEKLEKGSFDKTALFNQRIKIYDPFLAEVSEILAQQEQLLREILDSNRRFVESRQTNDMIRQRETALQSLENAYKLFKEISANLEEGVKFYSDIEIVLNRFLTNCRDFGLAREVDKRDTITQIQVSVANMRISDVSPAAASTSRSAASGSSAAAAPSTTSTTLPPPILAPSAPSYGPPPPGYAPSYGSAPPVYATGASGYASTMPPQPTTSNPSLSSPSPPHQQAATAPPPTGTWNPGQPISYASSQPPSSAPPAGGYYMYVPAGQQPPGGANYGAPPAGYTPPPPGTVYPGQSRP